MTITVTFEPNSQFTVADIPSLLIFGLFGDELLQNDATTFNGSGRYDGIFATWTGTGSNLNLADGIPTILDSFTFDFRSEIVDFQNTNLDFYEFAEAGSIALVNDDFTDLVLLLTEQAWDMTLSNNDDSTGYEIGDDGIEFNLKGNDTIRSLGGDDQIFTGDGNDKIYGGNGADFLDGGNGADLVNGGRGADLIFGFNGADTLVGKGGNDVIYGENGNDQISGNAGSDVMLGGRGKDALYGGNGADTVSGNKGSDAVYGNRGNDILEGGGGADKIYAGRGNDDLYGGAGADKFIFNNNDGDNVIHDFNATNDREDVDLKGVSAITSFDDLSNNHMEQVGADVVIDDGANLTITLLNVSISDLGAQDFMF